MNKLINLDITVEVHESVPTMEVIQKIRRMLNQRGGIESISIGATSPSPTPIPYCVPKSKLKLDN